MFHLEAGSKWHWELSSGPYLVKYFSQWRRWRNTLFSSLGMKPNWDVQPVHSRTGLTFRDTYSGWSNELTRESWNSARTNVKTCSWNRQTSWWCPLSTQMIPWFIRCTRNNHSPLTNNFFSGLNAIPDANTLMCRMLHLLRLSSLYCASEVPAYQKPSEIPKQK